MKRHLLIDITCYLTAFLLIQTGVYIASTLLCKALSLPQSATQTVAASTLSSLLTIAVFAWRKWASVRGGITGGMIPKLQNCIGAIENGVSRVHILDGRIPHCLLLEIFTKKGIGTAILKENDPD